MDSIIPAWFTECLSLDFSLADAKGYQIGQELRDLRGAWLLNVENAIIMWRKAAAKGRSSHAVSLSKGTGWLIWPPLLEALSLDVDLTIFAMEEALERAKKAAGGGT